MTFTETDPPLTLEEISQIENEIGLQFPQILIDHYLKWNGGCPDPYMYEDEILNTSVTQALSLKTDTDSFTAVQAYRDLVEVRQAPKRFFPFAIDGGGDYFLIDCSAPRNPVYFFRTDIWPVVLDKCLIDLNRSFEDFWKHLKPEA